MQSEREEIIESIRVRLKTYRESLIRRLGGHWPTEDALREAVSGGKVDIPAVSELEKTEAALAKIREGTFGLCEECGLALAGERLEVVPFARVCVGCQLRTQKRHTAELN